MWRTPPLAFNLFFFFFKFHVMLLILVLKDGLNSCWVRDLSWLFKIPRDTCCSSHCSWLPFLYIFSTCILLSCRETKGSLHPGCGCALTRAGCHRGSSSLVLCALLTNPKDRNCFLSSEADRINAQTQAPPCWIYFPDAWQNWSIHLQWLSCATLMLTHLETWELSFMSHR